MVWADGRGMAGFIRRNWRWILIGVSAATIALTVLGLVFGFPFFALFLFFPFIGLNLFGGSRREEPDDGTYCPECGYSVDPGDAFCRVCGRNLR